MPIPKQVSLSPLPDVFCSKKLGAKPASSAPRSALQSPARLHLAVPSQTQAEGRGRSCACRLEGNPRRRSAAGLKDVPKPAGLKASPESAEKAGRERAADPAVGRRLGRAPLSLQTRVCAAAEHQPLGLGRFYHITAIRASLTTQHIAMHRLQGLATLHLCSQTQPISVSAPKQPLHRRVAMRITFSTAGSAAHLMHRHSLLLISHMSGTGSTNSTVPSAQMHFSCMQVPKQSQYPHAPPRA